MKKLTALLLALVLFASAFSTVYAAEELSTEAKACVALGVLKGKTGTVDAAYTRTEPNRLQVAIMVLRLRGIEEEALTFSGTSNFKDAGEVNWEGGKAVMAYLKAHPELGWIGDNGYFKPNDMMSVQAYYKVLLESLGYTQKIDGGSGDFLWNDTIKFAAAKGLRRVSAVKEFTVNDMSIATIEALKAKLKGSTKSLAEDLVQKGKLDKTAAVASGVIEGSAVFAVSKVEASNLVEVKVVFTDKVDKLSAENTKNYSIKKHEISSALVQADGKSVILTLNISKDTDNAIPFEHDEGFILTINGISNEDKTQSVLNYETKELTAGDTGVPAAEKIELVGPYKVKITFNEPIKDTSNAKVEINDGEYDAVFETANSTRDVYVTLSDILDDGKYSMMISGAKDFMGYSSPRTKLTLNYKEITTPPTVSVVSSTERQVIVQFNRPVVDESGDALNGSYFYHSNTNIHPDATTKDNQTYILDFLDEPLPEGSVKFVVLYKAGDSAITDEWGNEMKSNASFTLRITADKKRPEVKEVKAEDEQTLLIYFSEALSIDTAVNIDNYVVEDEDGKGIDISDADYTVDTTDDEYVVVLKFKEKLNGTYTVEISDIEDMAAEPNVMAAKTFTVEVKDIIGVNLRAVTATTIEGTGDKPDYIYITFPEKMTTEGQYGILNKQNYLLSNDAGDDFATLEEEDTISLMSDNNSVRIALEDNDIYDVDDEDFRISIGRVADEAGNKSALFAATVNPVPDAPIEAIGFAAVDMKTVEVTFDGIIKTAPISGFRISKSGGTAAAPSAVRLRYEDTDGDGSNETIASLTLKSSQQLKNSDAEGVLEVSIMERAVKSETSTYCEESPDNPVSDGIPPIITDMEQAGSGSIEISFDEEIDVTNPGLASTDFVIRDKNSKVLLAGVDYSVSVDSSSITITLTGKYEDYTGRITIDTKDSVTYIYDADGINARLKAYGTPKSLTLE